MWLCPHALDVSWFAVALKFVGSARSWGLFMNFCLVFSVTEGASLFTLKSRPHQLVHSLSVCVVSLFLFCGIVCLFSTAGGTCGPQQTELICLRSCYRGFTVESEILQQLLPFWRLIAKQATNIHCIHSFEKPYNVIAKRQSSLWALGFLVCSSM